MFTGIIRYLGHLTELRGGSLTVECAELLPAISEGDSVAVNGVCLTAVRMSKRSFEADLLEATLQDTTLGRLPPSAVVNLEPALLAGDRLGGHFVSGHVDATADVLNIAEDRIGNTVVTLSLPEVIADAVVPKGSICVDGVSLTVQELSGESFTVSLIPATLEMTSLGRLKTGAQVNLEADLLVKAVRHLLRLGAVDNMKEQSG